ncbi:hypothetical protein I6I10_07415 [Corynebacterium glucuronolyticum]|uniref:Uncharacterized protein n=1 Tax=Corynebacterium glucuronolyticum TaxID=39791 RepID=A0A7T4EDL5_9CORY|nr:hypothetical protein [Corynebacterium glucuronolyticum]QQB45364.1 hypothetical protein I6I10_07415 [Corynebacterium glucuronolyticum]WKD64019.1 hypothetical protein CGLUCO_08870 [Corynebacterium glucuronolyticum DSM 44120]SMB81551.1 hypothetical protein SAMN05660745_02444 [Corynebacterium glucuronolyticum]
MTDWESWQKHVRRVVEQKRAWYGIGDGDGTPVATLPTPVSKETPEQWMEASDLSLTIPARHSDGIPTGLCKGLVTDNLRLVDPSGQIPLATGDFTLLFAMMGENGILERRGGVITHVDGDDPDGTGQPTELVLHALSVSDVWNTIPAPSWPASWWAATPYEVTTDESGLSFGQPWTMAKIEMSTRATFTLKQGRAGFVIRRLAQESLDAAMFTQLDPDGTRWVDDPYHVVEVPAEDNTPEVSFTVADGSLWDTVAGVAKNAGVILGARMWWPGDPPVRCWTPASSSMSPAQVDISPSEGEPYRTVSERTFPHAMTVLTVKEVA